MSREQATLPPRRVPAARGQRRGHPRPSWTLAALAALAVVLAAGILWWGRPGSTGAPSIAADRNVQGDSEAPVLIEEWGDFQ